MQLQLKNEEQAVKLARSQKLPTLDFEYHTGRVAVLARRSGIQYGLAGVSTGLLAYPLPTD